MADMNHSNTLFVRETLGDIHFYMVPCEERKTLKPLIEHGGGSISNQLRERSIRLLPTGTEAKSDGMIKSSYVLDCVKANRLLKLDSYRLKKGDSVEEDIDIETHDPHVMRMEAKDRRGRAKFFLEEQRAIIEYLVTDLQYTEAKGNAVWKTMEKNKVTKHTWQSMKDHFHKIMLPRIHSFGLSKTDIARLTGDWTSVREDIRQEEAKKKADETRRASKRTASSKSDVPGEDSAAKRTMTRAQSQRQGLRKRNVESQCAKPKRSMDKDADTASDVSKGSTGKGRVIGTIVERVQESTGIMKVEGAEKMTETSKKSKENVAETSKQSEEKVAETSKKSEEKVAETSKQSEEQVAETSKKSEEKVAETSKQREEKVAETSKQSEEKGAETSKQSEEKGAETSKQSEEKGAETSKQSEEKGAETSKQSEEKGAETSKQSEEKGAETSKQTRKKAVVRPTLPSEKVTEKLPETSNQNTAKEAGKVLATSSKENQRSKSKRVEKLARGEETPKHVESPSKNVESSSKHVESPSKHVESPSKHVESPSKHVESPSKHVEASSKKEENGKLNRSAEVIRESVVDTSSMSMSSVISPIRKTPKTPNQARLSVTHISASDDDDEGDVDEFDLGLLLQAKGNPETTSAIATSTRKSSRQQAKRTAEAVTTTTIVTSTTKSPRRQSSRLRDGNGGEKHPTGNDEAPEQESPRKRARRNLELTTLSEPQSKPALNTSLNNSLESSKPASKAKRNLEQTLLPELQSKPALNSSLNISMENSKTSKTKRNLEQTTLPEPQSKPALNTSLNNSLESSKPTSKAKRNLEQTTLSEPQSKPAENTSLNNSLDNSKLATKGKDIPHRPNLAKKSEDEQNTSTGASGDCKQSTGSKTQSKASVSVRNLLMSQEEEEEMESDENEEESTEAPGVEFEKAKDLVTRTCERLGVEPAELLDAVYHANGSMKQAVHSILYGQPQEGHVLWNVEDDTLLETGTDTDVEELEIRYGTDALIKRQQFLADFSKDTD